MMTALTVLFEQLCRSVRNDLLSTASVEHRAGLSSSRRVATVRSGWPSALRADRTSIFCEGE
jgi:hypothetical protein